VSERPKERASKAREGSRPPWVQIPPLPPTTRLTLGNLVGASNVLPRPSRFRLIRPAGHAASLRLVPCMDGVASCAIIRGMRAYGEQRPLGAGWSAVEADDRHFRHRGGCGGGGGHQDAGSFLQPRNPAGHGRAGPRADCGNAGDGHRWVYNPVVGGSAQDAVEQRTTEFYTLLVDQLGRPLRSKGHISGETCTSVTRVLAGTRGSE
jgi:hypothetical protein